MCWRGIWEFVKFCGDSLIMSVGLTGTGGFILAPIFWLIFITARHHGPQKLVLIIAIVWTVLLGYAIWFWLIWCKRLDEEEVVPEATLEPPRPTTQQETLYPYWIVLVIAALLVASRLWHTRKS